MKQKITLVINETGMILRIPGLFEIRTPAKIDISRSDINTVLSCLKQNGVEDFTIVSGNKVEEPKKKTVKKERNSTEQKIVDQVLTDFKNDKSTSSVDLDSRFNKIEILLLDLLSKQSSEKQVIVEKAIEVKKVKEDTTKADFIPSINLDRLVSKGDSAKTIKGEDVSDTASLLRNMGKKGE